MIFQVQTQLKHLNNSKIRKQKFVFEKPMGPRQFLEE